MKSTQERASSTRFAISNFNQAAGLFASPPFLRYREMESAVLKAVMLRVGSLPNVRVFRNNTGQGWVGQMTRQGALTILKNARPLNAGLVKGSSDLIGWTTLEITPDMVGRKVAVFTAIECKTDSGRTDAEQLKFLQNVQAAGGIAIVARDAETAVGIIKNHWLYNPK